MSARVLKLPRTAKGRALLRCCFNPPRSWDFPDGSKADETDWDVEAIEVERLNDEYEKWCKEQEENKQ